MRTYFSVQSSFYFSKDGDIKCEFYRQFFGPVPCRIHMYFMSVDSFFIAQEYKDFKRKGKIINHI